MRLFSFEGGLLLANPDHELKVKVLHLQTRKTGVRRKTPTGKSPIEFIVNHVTAFERPKFDMGKLALLMRLAKLSEGDQARIREELGKSPTFPGALYQCLQNEGDANRQASWDFLVETKRDGTINVVQYNCQIDARYAWHAGPSKKRYGTRNKGEKVYNRDKQLVWDGEQFVYPPGGGVNAKSIGIENSFYAGPLRREADGDIVYPFNSKLIDVTSEERRNGDIIEAEGKLFERATPVHMAVLAQLNGAICDHFGIKVDNIKGHYHFDPIDRSVDPVFTIPLAELRELVLRG